MFDPDIFGSIIQDLEALKNITAKLELCKYPIQALQGSVTGSESMWMEMDDGCSRDSALFEELHTNSVLLLLPQYVLLPARLRAGSAPERGGEQRTDSSVW